MTMTWEEKLQALQALCETVLIMRKPGNWYVSASGRSIAGDGFLTGSYGNGATPEEAVEDDWNIFVVNLPLDRYINVSSYSAGKEKNVRWNGFMWADYIV